MNIKTIAVALGVMLAGSSAAMAQSCPSFNATGAVAEVTGQTLNRGIRAEVIAGTQLDVWDCPSLRMVGFMNAAPTLSLQLTDARARGLEILTESTCDPTLLIETPSGRFIFDDDNGAIGRGLDPAIALPAQGDGTYNIWVGSYRNTYCLTTLRVRNRR